MTKFQHHKYSSIQEEGLKLIEHPTLQNQTKLETSDM